MPAQGRRVAQLTGMLQSMRFAVQPVQICTKGLYVWLAKQPSDALGFATLSESAHLTPWVQAELSFWARRIWDWNGARVQPGFVLRVLYRRQCERLGQCGTACSEQAVRSQPQQWPAEDIESRDSVFTELSGLQRALGSNVVELSGQSVERIVCLPTRRWQMADRGGVHVCRT